MARLEYYREYLGCDSEQDIVRSFCASLSETNRTFDFYVDWEKARRNVSKHTEELSLLNSLLRAPREEVEPRLRDMVKKYPAVLSALPLLIAERAKTLKILDRDNQDGIQVMLFDFTPRPLSDEEVDTVLQFVRGVGLLDLLTTSGVNDLIDYLWGVEVGMDTNARKNRSGAAMETLLAPMVQDAVHGVGVRVYQHKTLTEIEGLQVGVVPNALRSRAMDFLLVSDGRKRERLLNIETNYFGGTGSKPEVVDAYIERQRLLADIGAEFVLVTDGPGWAGMQNLLQRAVESLNWLMNLEFVKRGLLAAVLQDAFAGT